MRAKITFTNKQISQIKSLFAEGWGAGRLAKKFGCSKKTMLKFIDEWDLRKTITIIKKAKFTADQLIVIKQLFDENISVRRISKQLNMTIRAVEAALKQLGLSRKAVRIKPSMEHVNLIQDLFAQGRSKASIARELGYSETTLDRLFERFDIINDEISEKRNSSMKENKKASKKRYSEKNKESIAKYHKQYAQNNKEELSAYHKQYYEDNKKEFLDNCKRYYEENRELVLARVKQYRKDNKEVLSDRKLERYRNDIVFKMRELASAMIRQALKTIGASKNGRSILDYLPDPIEQWWPHFEKKFSDPDNLTSSGKVWMTRDNHGIYNKETWKDDDPSTWTWNIDHIIPQSDLPYTSMEDENFKICWSLKNLRPMSAKQNIIDGARRTRHKKGT